MKHVWTLLLLVAVFFSTLAAAQPKAKNASASEADWSTKTTEAHPVTIMMTGDIMLGRYIATLRERNGGDFPFTHLPDIFSAVESALGTDHLDIVAANLEGPVVEQQIVWGGLNFAFNPDVAPQLKSAGFTLLQLSNNHTLNQKHAGLTETQEHLAAAGLDYFGVPDKIDDPTSFKSYDFDGLTVGFLGLDDVDYKLDQAATAAQIQALKPTVDVLIVGIHWGIEYRDTNTDHQQELAHAFIDAGADFIWGEHPHVVENSEVYHGKTIYYSLGNFVFDQYFSQDVRHGLVLGLRIAPDLTLTPVEIPVELVNGGEPQI